MKSRIPQVQIGFVVAFVVIFAALVAYQALYVWPADRCESQGDWWDGADRVCAVPVPISQFTGRRIGGKLVVQRITTPPAKPGG